MKRVLIICMVSLFVIILPNYLFAIPLPEGTDASVESVKLSPDNKIISARFVETTAINTPIGKIKVKGEVEFYESGKVKSCYYDDCWSSNVFETSVGEISLRNSGEEKYITFYESGCIEGFTSYSISNIQTPIGMIGATDAYFYDDWKVEKFSSCNSKYDFKLETSFGNVLPKDYSEISFYEDGKLKQFTTGEVMLATINSETVYINADNVVLFDEDGYILSYKPVEIEWKHSF